MWDRAANSGCGAICQPSLFRSCGFLRAWGSCPLRPPLPPWCLLEGRTHLPAPQPRPQEVLGLGAGSGGGATPSVPPYACGPADPTALSPFCQSPEDIAGFRGSTATAMFRRKRSVSFGGFGWWVTDGTAVEGMGANLAATSCICWGCLCEQRAQVVPEIRVGRRVHCRCRGRMEVAGVSDIKLSLAHPGEGSRESGGLELEPVWTRLCGCG